MSNQINQTNPMREIKISQLSLNIGVGKDEAQLKKGLKLLKKISGLEPVKTMTKKRIPGWGLRPGLIVGCKVTIRRNTQEMLGKLLAAKKNILARRNFDRTGSFSFGLPEYIDIPGLGYDPELKIMGLEAAVSLERAGFRLKRRKIRPKKIGKKHLITREEAIQFIQEKFGAKIE